MQKLLMTAGVSLAIALSMYSARVATKTRSEIERSSNLVSVAVANTDKLIDWHGELTTNQMKLRDYTKQVDDELGTEIKDRRALEAVVEQNAKELIRISGNLERDVDKMYTNIVMFGVTVFAAKEDISALALRLQDLERKALPAVAPAGPTLETPPSKPQSEHEKFIERFNIGPADLGPAPQN